MSNLRYIELCSNYRNRNQWHEPGEFEIPISQSGRKGATDAIDPVSLSAPFDSWPLGRFNVYSNSSSITLTIETTSIGTTSGTTILFVKGDTLNTLQIFKDYYAKCMITDIASSYKLRIETYDYLGVNKGKIVVFGSFNPFLAGTSVKIDDPTDFSNTSSPYLYVPGPSLGDNVLVNKIIYNETRDEYRPLGVYARDTNIVPIDTITNSSTSLSTRNSGPITNWTLTDKVCLRIKPPVPILSDSPLVPDRIKLDQDTTSGIFPTSISFNFPSTTTHKDLAGSFLNRLPYYGLPADITLVTSSSIIELSTVDATTVDKFWIGSFIRIVDTAVPDLLGQEREIINYTAGGIIEVFPPFSALPVVNDKYVIFSPNLSRRIEKYVNYTGSLQNNNTLTTLQFPILGSSNENNFYKDLFIKVGSEIKLITEYTITKNSTGAITSKTVTLNSALSSAPSLGTVFSITSGKLASQFPYILTSNTGLVTLMNPTFVILPFSYDNLNPFVYTGSLVSQQELVCYEVQLLNLVLPNVILGTASGSLVSFYPYVYVALQNVTSAGAGLSNIIYSNNPNSTKVLFRAPIKDVPNPVNSTFIKIDGSGMVQTIKFRPNDTLFFGVYLPNGEIFTTILDETMSPLPPNPVIQISACFSIKRLS